MINLKALRSAEDMSMFYIDFGSQPVAGDLKNSKSLMRHIRGPYPFSTLGDELESQNSVINTPKPAPFSLGAFGNISGGPGENNCFHTQISGTIDLTKYPDTSDTDFKLIEQSSNYFGTPIYRHFLPNGTYVGTYPSDLGLCQNGTTTYDRTSTYRYCKGIVLNPKILHPGYPGYYWGVYEWSTTSYSAFRTTFRSQYTIDNGNYYQSAEYTATRIDSSSYRPVIFYSVRYCDQSIETDAILSEVTVERSFNLIRQTQPTVIIGLTAYDMGYYIERLSARISSVARNAFEFSKHLSYYDPCKKAVESVSAIDMNNIENAVQAKDPKGILPPIKELMQIKKHPAKAIASLHLWYKYAAKTSVKDVIEIVKNFDAITDTLLNERPAILSKYGTVHSTETFLKQEIIVRKNVKVVLTPMARTPAEAAQHKLAALGLEASFASLWDLVPFSFVLDWFIGVGDVLEDIDYALFTQNRFDVHAVTSSAKFSFGIPAHVLDIPEEMCSGLTMSSYYRQCQTQLPSNEFSFGSSNPTAHILDGAALIIANW